MVGVLLKAAYIGFQRKSLVLRSDKPFMESERMFKGRAESKAQIIYRFIEENCDGALFTREIADLLTDRGII
ncbi:MAG: hypothetical protein QW374_00770 [Candidatus Bathyarchaeia archaeon]